MEAQQANVRLTERVKLLAYDDAVLGRPVLVDLVFAPSAGNLEELAAKLDLVDVVELVRAAHRKLPRHRGVTEAELEREESPDRPAEAAELNVELPRDLVTKRFAVPDAFDRTLRRSLAEHGTATALKPLLFGHGEGDPLRKLGLLGRAAVEEQAGTADLPFYYATLLVVLREFAEQLQTELVDDAKVKAAYDEVRGQLMVWSRRHLARVKRAALVERVLNNPLAPWAFNRRTRIIAAQEATEKCLGLANEYGLTLDAARALDAQYGGELGALGDDAAAHEALRRNVLAVADRLDVGDAYLHRERRAAALLAPAAAVLGGAAAAAGGWLGFGVTEAVAGGAGVAAGLALAGGLALRVRRLAVPAWRECVRTRGALRRVKPLRRALAGALAAARGGKRARRPRMPTEAWTGRVPRLLRAYAKLKADQDDYGRLCATALPPLDASGMYQGGELREKWSQNAAVCFDDEFPTLVVGAARTAAVYFIDVAGSTELSTTQALGNALELYTRVLPLANEDGGEPLWRKEVGDGRYYSYPVHEALRRAVLTAQACRHPKVGMGIGVGLSVSEIYTDVRTGDFLNEAANRASRLNARDEIVGAYMAARYVRRPFSVYVKYGRLFNAGVALDEKALHALGVEGWEAEWLVPPLEQKFPLLGEEGEAGSVSLFAERLTAETATARLGALDGAPGMARFAGHLAEVLPFEVFCHVSGRAVRYATAAGEGGLRGALRAAGAENASYAAREMERDATVTHLPVALPDGQTFSVVVKYERANLKGLGPTAVAEVSIPAALSDPAGGLTRFLGSL